MANATERLKLIADLEAQGFVRGSREMQREIQRIEKASLKATRRSGQSWTQLAYALDDAQYGFRGVQNNLQAIAVTAGASGPVVLGLTAALVVIGALVDKMEFFKDKIKEIRKETKKFGEDLVTHLGGESKAQEEFARQKRDQVKGLEDLIKGGNKGAALTEKQLESYKERVKTLKQEASEHERLAKLLAKQQSDLINANAKAYATKKQEQAAKKAGKRDKVGSVNELIPEGTSLEQLKEWQKDATRLMKSFAHAWGQEWKKIGDISTTSGEDVTNSLKIVQERLGHNMVETTKKLTDLGQALQASLTDAFVGLGESIGNALKSEDFGKGLLSIVAQFMQSFGAALIAIGVAKLSLETNVPGGALIAAGIGLVAAGTLLAPGGAGHFGSNGVSASSSRAASPVAVRTQSDSANNAPIAIARIKGQDLELAIQNANYSRRGFIPT